MVVVCEKGAQACDKTHKDELSKISKNIERYARSMARGSWKLPTASYFDFSVIA